MATAVRDDMFTPDVIADPYGYYGRLRDEDPVHWNDTYGLWVITRHDDVTWLTRHHELFSSAVFKNDPRPAYPAIDESDLGLYEYVRHYQGDQFIQHDRPEHLDMRRGSPLCPGARRKAALHRPRRIRPHADPDRRHEGDARIRLAIGRRTYRQAG
jgi:cytochrome P450